MEPTEKHTALIIFGSLALLWLFGGKLFKAVRV